MLSELTGTGAPRGDEPTEPPRPGRVRSTRPCDRCGDPEGEVGKKGGLTPYRKGASSYGVPGEVCLQCMRELNTEFRRARRRAKAARDPAEDKVAASEMTAAAAGYAAAVAGYLEGVARERLNGGGAEADRLSEPARFCRWLIRHWGDPSLPDRLTRVRPIDDEDE